MGFIDNISTLMFGKTHTADEYVDLGWGLPWFKEYREKGNQTLSDFFGLQKENQIEIQTTISKTGFYQTEKGKRWAVIAKYSDEQQNEFTFYCPEWTYDPIDEYSQGKTLKMFVDKNDFSKYEMPIY
jgi:hypothetical protein